MVYAEKKDKRDMSKFGSVIAQLCAYREVCKKCGENWGSPARACFIKDHNLVYVERDAEEKDR